MLDESHPPARRTRFAPRPLLAGYVSFGRDRLFWPLLISSSVNFAGLFLYIASAPQIVRGLLGLSAQGFPWLFLPVVIGLIAGAWWSGHLAGGAASTFTVNLGYVVMLLACATHVSLAMVFPAPRLPWSMLPLVLHGVGVQLAFPTLTLLLLDRFPHHRGGISSVQAFASLLLQRRGGWRAVAAAVRQHVAPGAGRQCVHPDRRGSVVLAWTHTPCPPGSAVAARYRAAGTDHAGRVRCCREPPATAAVRRWVEASCLLSRKQGQCMSPLQGRVTGGRGNGRRQ